MRQIETREEKMCSGELISDGPEKEKDFTHKSSAMGITFDLDTCVLGSRLLHALYPKTLCK